MSTNPFGDIGSDQYYADLQQYKRERRDVEIRTLARLADDAYIAGRFVMGEPAKSLDEAHKLIVRALDMRRGPA